MFKQDDNTVLTAGHCCIGFVDNPEAIRVIIGEHSTMNDSDGQEVLKVASVIIHPEFEYNTFANDICILKTASMNLS